MRRPDSISTRIFRLLRGGFGNRVSRLLGRPQQHNRDTGSWSGFEEDSDHAYQSTENRANHDLVKHYAALELSDGANLTEVKAAYKRLMKRYHPDKFQDADKKATATELVKGLNEAYAVLNKHLA